MRALVCDDQAMVRAGIRLILESQPDIDVVGEASDGEEAVAAARRLSPDVVLMDIRMPRLDGIEATRRICSQDPSPAVIVLTTFDADEYVYGALRAGASGFMLKDSAPEQLVATLRLAVLGDALVTPLRTRALIERHAEYTDSPRARWVLDNWASMLPKFYKVFPKEYKRVLDLHKKEAQSEVRLPAEVHARG